MKKGQKILLIIVVILILGFLAYTAYTLFEDFEKPEPNGMPDDFPDDKGSCGNDYCEAMEWGACEEDCPTIGIQETKTDAEFEEGVLYLNLMVHMEPWDADSGVPYNEDVYRVQVEATRLMAEIFENHDARATFEAREGVVDSYNEWGDNILKELYDTGHGVGIHADRGGGDDMIHLAQEEFADILSNRKAKAQEMIGAEIRHVSGICSSLDWVQAAVEAGYEFTTGEVAMCLASVPEEDLPEGFEDCTAPLPCPDKYHQPMPYDLEDRMHPWRMNSGADWLEHSSNGELVMVAADRVMYDLSETEEEEGTGAGKESDFFLDDIELAMEQIEEALELVEDDQVNTMYFSWSIGNAGRVNEEIFNEWFDQVQPYVDSGQIKWATIPEMYDIYLDWESQQ